MTYQTHALTELKLLGWVNEDGQPLESDGTVATDGPNKWIIDNLFELLDVLSSQGHSGSSIHYIISLFTKCALFKPLTPLTGEDNEWGDDIGDGTVQNKRYSSIFKLPNGRAYWLDGYAFKENGELGPFFTNSYSRKYISFPLDVASLTTIYLTVPKDLPRDQFPKYIRAVDPTYEEFPK